MATDDDDVDDDDDDDDGNPIQRIVQITRDGAKPARRTQKQALKNNEARKRPATS